MLKNRSHTPYRLLLIEDNMDDVELTFEALKESKTDLDIYHVSDGFAALRFLHQEDEYAEKPIPDLILLDLNLPVMDGREVLSTIREDQQLNHIPIIVLTTSSNDEDIRNAYKLNANCYIQKPLDFNQFSQIISKIDEFWLQLAKLPKER